MPFPLRKSFFLCSILFLLFVSGKSAAAAGAAGLTAKVPGDRWMEIDLYWFNQADLPASADEFWNRFAPLYQDMHGDTGVVLNIGWTVNYIMEFSGDLSQHLMLPAGSGQQPWVKETGALPGTTEDRKREWKERFSHPVMIERKGYGDWTYADVKQLATLLREGAAKRGIRNFKVGSLCYAWTNAYGEPAPFFRLHPEAWTKWAQVPKNNFDFDNYFDPEAKLHADPLKRGGFPKGFPEGTPVHEAFGAQWGALSRQVGLDAIMLRDSFGFPAPYMRSGPLGDLMPNPQVIRQFTAGVSNLLRDTKRANPAALTMMYSNGASAISDWRSNGCDLEAVAKEGNLDIFVDQTWAGAWNEIGIRHNIFWNFPLLGWTFQLAYMLEHSAILADTKVKHYPLVETFDAWESWDTLHTVPDRLRWGIWAYSHAGVKSPTGLRMPEGSYISWANQGKRLLSDEDVQFLNTTINAALVDAHQIREIYGPTLVYSRDSMQYQAEHASANHEIKEWTDEQMALVIKWPVPVLSITRAEWIPQVKSDLFVFGAPSYLRGSVLHSIETLAKQGQPMAFVGSTVDGIDPALLHLAGWSAKGTVAQPSGLHTGQLSDFHLSNTLHAPTNFPILQSSGPASALPGTVVYSVEQAPALTLQQSSLQNLSVWDPPNLRGECCKELIEILNGSAAPYALAAAVLTKQLASAGALRASVIDFEQTGSVGAWKTEDGRLHLLAGNLEEGLRDDADHTRHISLSLPDSWKAIPWISSWNSEQYSGKDGLLQINLGPERAVLLISGPGSSPK